MKRAYRTTWNGIVSIVAAESVAQARRRVQVMAKDVGWSASWIDIRVVRAPEYDAWAAKETSPRCFDPQWLPKGGVR